MATTKQPQAAEGSEEGPPVCPVSICPVGMFLTFTGQARPEVVEHLLKAGRELMLAATAFMNARAEALGQKPRLEKIDLD
jgi:hypothetical protein